VDAVYFVRKGPNEELRYSLRSLANVTPMPENVWIVGDPPDWYTGPRIPGNRFRSSKPRNVYDNVRILAEHPDLPEHVSVWNDDMYALEPVPVTMAYRGGLIEHIAGLNVGATWWRQSLTITLHYLRRHGHPKPLSYELHRPFPIVRSDMARILAEAARVRPANPPQWRTLYGVLADAGGEQAPHDGKVYGGDRPIPAGPWLSSTDRNFDKIRGLLTNLYPDPSPWEG
jgi:hypothetical protein